ncbi:uncharacterized protein [Coffea arabica]|uniref:Uncharacterized protein isoform X2 n=2 Tax=Coffea arabica TaxID=13443 RepID=A0ABM4V0N8_COFAR
MAFQYRSSPSYLQLQAGVTGKWDCCRFVNRGLRNAASSSTTASKKKRAGLFFRNRCSATAMSASVRSNSSRSADLSSTWGKKLVWIWTENKQVMTTAVERGWNTFIFPSTCRDLATEWSWEEVLDSESKRIAAFSDITSPQQLEKLQSWDDLAQIVVVNLLDWQVIPAENIVAAFQGSQRTVLAISKTPSEAQVFLEALEHGLDGVVLKVDDAKAILELKDYFNRRNEADTRLNLTKATVMNVQMAGMGDRVCVDLCSLMRPGEGLLVGSFARGLFLVHSECLESNYISSRPFRVNAGPVHAYVAIPGSKTSYLSELKTGKEVIVVDQSGVQRTAIVGRVKIESRPLVLVEAKGDSENNTYSILLQNAETVALVSPVGGEGCGETAIPVTSLKVGDEILLSVQGDARHTGIEIEEFVVEK